MSLRLGAGQQSRALLDLDHEMHAVGNAVLVLLTVRREEGACGEDCDTVKFCLP